MNKLRVDYVTVYDFREGRDNPPKPMKKYKRRGKVVERDPSVITGITIHQTAVKYDVREYQIHNAGGDRNLALAKRALNVACHAMVFHDGFISLTNPLQWYVYHGNGFNATELGLEIDGNYPGLIGGETWNKKSPTELSDKIIHAARVAIKILVAEGLKQGMSISYIHAHRQSSKTRRSDPGEEIWKRVVLEYAVPILGLKTQPDLTLKNGRPIPIEWDKQGVGNY